jgi:hypothetical protein
MTMHYRKEYKLSSHEGGADALVPGEKKSSVISSTKLGVVYHETAKRQELPSNSVVQTEGPVDIRLLKSKEVGHDTLSGSEQNSSTRLQSEEEISLESKYRSELKEFIEQRAQRRKEYQAQKALQAQLAEFWEQRAQARRAYNAEKARREGGRQSQHSIRAA